MLETRFIVELGIFYVLLILQAVKNGYQFPYFKKQTHEWIADLSGLLIQGFFIPLVAIILLHRVFEFFFPSIHGVWVLSPVLAFLLNFVFVDYVYYWFHRLMHTRRWWFLHVLHHSANEMDILNTSRNPLITHFLLPYIWLNSIFIFLLKDPSSYIIAFSITAMLDLWRHSTLYPEHETWYSKILDSVLITPKTHAWHHSRLESSSYFGANFNWWDRLHLTHKPELLLLFPRDLGIPLRTSLKNQILTPWKIFSKEQG
jgi:sterol desaturase/sphingolipid hydroxylase (fatty acid hydroxylase superfamily)